MKGERERKIRTVIKTALWRGIAAALTFAVAFLITKDTETAVEIFGLRELLAIIAYYAHERMWNHVSWGKYRLEKLAKGQNLDANSND